MLNELLLCQRTYNSHVVSGVKELKSPKINFGPFQDIYKHNRDDIKIESIDATAHRFEVRRKDVYELLRGEKYLKPKKREIITVEEETSIKKLKSEIPKSARRVVTTLLPPPSAEDQAAAGASHE